MRLNYISLIIFLTWFTSCQSQTEKPDYQIHGVPFNEVKINDIFWLPKIETTREVTIPASFAKCEETGRVANFVKAAEKKGKFGTTFPFDDTDIYKIIEGASYLMSVHPDPKLDRYVDSLIVIIGKAQEADPSVPAQPAASPPVVADVPPPKPQVTKTMSAPLTASWISSRVSSAARRPRSAFMPVPRPRVRFLPILMRFFARERWRS